MAMEDIRCQTAHISKAISQKDKKKAKENIILMTACTKEHFLMINFMDKGLCF
jgi:hypothetical protein